MIAPIFKTNAFCVVFLFLCGIVVVSFSLLGISNWFHLLQIAIRKFLRSFEFLQLLTSKTELFLKLSQLAIVK